MYTHDTTHYKTKEYHQSTMSFLSRFTLISCLLIHTQYFLGNKWIADLLHGHLPLFYNIIQGVSYLLYPLFGWIADINANNFTMIKLSFVAMLISSLCMFCSGLCSYLYPGSTYLPAAIFGFLFALVGISGLGMFEANAIQFGMDQLMDASSVQLSSFIHWYFWSVNIGPLLLFYMVVGSIVYVSKCKIRADNITTDLNHSLGIFLLFPASLQILISFVCLSFIYLRKSYFCIEQISKNPLKIVFDVLKYSYYHKYPERRSAFTYWENDIPSRIDLGKEKYGGPFTYEQVEDVKTLLRLLLLMVSLFGFHLSCDGYSLTNYILETSGCPDPIPLMSLIMNPLHIILLVGSITVPVFELFKTRFHRYIPSLLSRLWFGLFVCLLNEGVQCWYGMILHKSNIECFHIDLENDTLIRQCLITSFKLIINNTSCSHVCHNTVNDQLYHYTIYLTIVPFLLFGLAHLLVFLTMLEFICAQSPNAMKGLLIGVWYSMLSIKYFITDITDRQRILAQTTSWYYYHGAKGVAIFTSLVIFSFVRDKYRFRERNEIVNEQFMIEEQYERELLLNNDSIESDTSSSIDGDY